MSLLEIKNLSHTYGDKILYKDESLVLFKGEHMGIVGCNGTGKSTLIGMLSGEIIPDRGRIVWQPNIKLGHLDQHAVVLGEYTATEYLKTAFQNLYILEERMNKLYEKYASIGNEKDLLQAAECQTLLETREFYLIESRIEKVMNGLGLSAIGGDKLLSKLSGGQRAKVILAKLLLEEPDVLLLDEPTNFLDKEHVLWLSEYLSVFPNAFAVVSHDYDLLEKISSCICDIDGGIIRKYTGKYSDFLKQKEHLREEHIRRYHAQQQQIKKTEEFIRKNIAGVNSKNAKGRRKQLERMERIAPPSVTIPKPDFYFLESPSSAHEVLKVKNLEVGYYYSLLPPLNFTINGGQKIVITGFNGIGKSTLLKTLTGYIEKISGEFMFDNSVRLGYYEQDITWEDPLLTPIQIITKYYPSLNIKEARRQLSRCGISNDHAIQAVSTLSGGEQAKVKLCKLILSPCNFLILDEPINHLDFAAKEALQNSLKDFGGTVLIVCHEETFYRSWADQVINIEIT
ncbi:ATP-binding cassette domain-containing protein [Tissierella carlieri]|uniref:ATP-binding cassette domain-containing protein n=1 Tax=Tissierella carlieri TaxID=689904 RepID=A0ABT1S6Q3_9FIRM|nr:ABC-F family ATP-binding cassette domain-containing protein [Tissierella carlieri]MCQ4922027.1 ATP-binding cassette domain-containing protein [Tissierella carlieri]